MSRRQLGYRRLFPRVSAAAVVAAAGLLVTTASHTSATGTPDIARVEEDWELVLDEPSNIKDAPQLMTVMSPYSHLNDLHGMVTWNYREIPEFYSGGLQLQSWADDLFLYSKNFRESEFSTTGETITWTQQLKIKNYILTLRVKDGNSETWGSFGGTEMKLSELIFVNNLNNYSPEVSVANSAVTYGAYRVIKLRIKEVRYYDEFNNLVATDTTSRVVHARPEADD